MVRAFWQHRGEFTEQAKLDTLPDVCERTEVFAQINCCEQ
jgi:hypothetical protein